MAFTLSAAQTINGVANSYIVTGTGNIDDLATACSAIGMSRVNGVVTFNPAVNRILAVSGTLTDDRSGVRSVLIRGGGHICWAYDAASVVTLGKYSSELGVYTGSVDVIYESGALTLGGDNNSGAQGKCFAGAGTLNFVNGSLAYQHSSTSHFDVWNGSTLCSFDNVSLYLAPNGSYSHIWKASGKTVTTAKTVCVFVQRPMEGVAAVTEVSPFYIDTGYRWPSATAGSILRVLRPSYSAVDTASSNAACEINVIDPATPYVGWCNDQAIYSFHAGIKRVFRTLNVTWSDLLGSSVTGAKLVVKSSTGSISSTNFSGKSASVELLQSTRASGVAHDSAGLLSTGYTDEGLYDAFLVGFGFSAKKASINLKTTNSGNSGVLWSQSTKKNELASIPVGSVVTAGFSFDKPTATLAITSSKTTDQIGQYLLKLAYDEATDAYWRNLNHNPASAASGVCDIGAINVSVASGAVISSGTVTTGLKTTGTVTLASGASASAPIEDSAGVRVTVKAPTPTTDFNISARYGTTTFTNLGFFTATGEITFTVPKGQPLEVAIWAFSYSTYVTTIDTTEGGSIFTAPLTINTAVDTTLNVDSYLSKIALSLDESGATPKLVLTVNEPMVVSGIELGKAITHKVAGLQVALTAALTFGDVTPLDIEPTEILNNLPAFSLVVGAAVPATGRVYFDFFINTAPAIAIDPTYVLNPIRADGNQVQILRVKPDVDPAQMAAGVIAGGVATSAQVLARPTLAQIEVAGGKLDTAMKAAKFAKLNTMG